MCVQVGRPTDHLLVGSREGEGRGLAAEDAVREAEETDAWRTLAQVEPRAGVPLERLLPGRGVEFLLMREILDTDVVSSSAEECLLALLIATTALYCVGRANTSAGGRARVARGRLCADAGGQGR